MGNPNKNPEKPNKKFKLLFPTNPVIQIKSR
jgi:hypothetical protein